MSYSYTIMSEIFILSLIILMVCQSSSIMSSLILIPSSIIFMFYSNTSMVYSGLMCYIFIMIFIGGLMVLLVSVASSVQQEQNSLFSTKFIFIATVMMYFMLSFQDYSDSNNMMEASSLMSVMDFSKNLSMLTILFILISSLFILSKLLLDFKGLIRVI